MKDFDNENVEIDPCMTISVRCLASEKEVPSDLVVNAILYSYFWANDKLLKFILSGEAAKKLKEIGEK